MPPAIRGSVHWYDFGQVRIPINVDGYSGPASALVHRVRSIDVPTRIVDKTGMVNDASLMTVGRALLTAVDR